MDEVTSTTNEIPGCHRNETRHTTAEWQKTIKPRFATESACALPEVIVDDEKVADNPDERMSLEDWHILDDTIMRLIEERYKRNSVSKWWDIDQKCRGFAHKMRQQNCSAEFIGAFIEIWDAVKELIGGGE